MADIREMLTSAPVLLEGAMGTMLIAAGLPAGEPGETYSLERPDIVADVHRRYAQAGARILITNTFNANRLRLGQTALADQLVACNQRAVRLARAQAADICLVAGSIGPTGQMLAPAGPLSRADAVSAFAEQAGILAAENVDFFLIETMYDVEEALAAIEGCRQASPKPVVASMTFSETPRGFFTMMGNPLVESLARMSDAGALAVGANCTLAGDAMVRLASVAKAAFDSPLLIEPNAGQPQAHGDRIVYAETPAGFANHVAALADLGIALIGGCCGTTPDHIAAARQKLDESKAA